jgi:hypothetical protein
MYYKHDNKNSYRIISLVGLYLRLKHIKITCILCVFLCKIFSKYFSDNYLASYVRDACRNASCSVC